jgi:hypothetical protein
VSHVRLHDDAQGIDLSFSLRVTTSRWHPREEEAKPRRLFPMPAEEVGRDYPGTGYAFAMY